jgi:hypothetical protein
MMKAAPNPSFAAIAFGLATCTLANCKAHAPAANHYHGRGAIIGTKAAVRTIAGPQDGYIIETRCAHPNCFGIRGAVGEWYPGMERDRIGEDARFRAGINRFREEMAKSVGVRSIHHSGFGVGCTGTGLFFWTNDWRDVDEAIAHIGAKLAQERLREEVTLCVESDSDVELQY